MNSIANVSLLECSFEQTLLGEIANWELEVLNTSWWIFDVPERNRAYVV